MGKFFLLVNGDELFGGYYRILEEWEKLIRIFKKVFGVKVSSLRVVVCVCEVVMFLFEE